MQLDVPKLQVVNSRKNLFGRPSNEKMISNQSAKTLNLPSPSNKDHIKIHQINLATNEDQATEPTQIEKTIDRSPIRVADQRTTMLAQELKFFETQISNQLKNYNADPKYMSNYLHKSSDVDGKNIEVPEDERRSTMLMNPDSVLNNSRYVHNRSTKIHQIIDDSLKGF